MMAENGPSQFTRTNAVELMHILQDREIMSSQQAEAVAYAFLDVFESIGKVYRELLPSLLSDSAAPSDALKERIWDIREEFRDIDYHIHDAALIEM